MFNEQANVGLTGRTASGVSNQVRETLQVKERVITKHIELLHTKMEQLQSLVQPYNGILLRMTGPRPETNSKSEPTPDWDALALHEKLAHLNGHLDSIGHQYTVILKELDESI